MASLVHPIISTAIGIGSMYAGGATNVVVGGGLALTARRRLQESALAVTRYKTLKNEIRQIRQEKVDKSPSKSEDAYDPNIDDTIDKIKTATDNCFESTLISKQLKQVESTYRVDKANQASFYAQSVMGGAQVAAATSSIGHAAFAVTMGAIGLSFISAIFYLGASIYGFVAAQKQLSENRQRQQDVVQAITNIKNNTDNTFEEHVSIDPDSEVLERNEINIDAAQVETLENTLEALKTEEAFLVQQRAAQAINIVAALLSLVAISLLTFSTYGTAPAIISTLYYAFLFASVLLPLIAKGYSHYSMNETKYMKALQEQLNRSPLARANVKIDEKITSESLLGLIIPMLNLEIANTSTRKEVKDLLEDFINKLDSLGLSARKEQEKKLHELFNYLTTLQDRLIKEDLYCRLRIAGMKLSDLD